MTWSGGYTTICRLCLQQDGFLLAIFNNHSAQNGIITAEHRSIQKKIVECTGLEVRTLFDLRLNDRYRLCFLMSNLATFNKTVDICMQECNSFSILSIAIVHALSTFFFATVLI